MEGKRIVLLVYVMVMLTSAVSADAKVDPGIRIQEVGEDIRIKCEGNLTKDGIKSFSELEYKDSNSGQYTCKDAKSVFVIFVKLRTCENCVQLDAVTLAGVVVAEVVATVMIGVAVYIVASHPHVNVHYQASKASDRQNLIQNQQSDSLYQPLSHANVSEYGRLEPRRVRRP